MKMLVWRIKTHLRVWNRWRKNHLGSKLFKAKVLLKLETPPTYCQVRTKMYMMNVKAIGEALAKGFEEATYNFEKVNREFGRVFGKESENDNTPTNV